MWIIWFDDPDVWNIQQIKLGSLVFRSIDFISSTSLRKAVKSGKSGKASKVRQFETETLDYSNQVMENVNYPPATSIKALKLNPKFCGLITLSFRPPLLISNDVGRMKFNSIIGTCFILNPPFKSSGGERKSMAIQSRRHHKFISDTIEKFSTETQNCFQAHTPNIQQHQKLKYVKVLNLFLGLNYGLMRVCVIGS